MSDDPIVFARADLPSSARSFSWGASASNGSTSYSENRDRVRFDHRELKRILDLYGAMVMAGVWRDYAIDFRGDVAVFSGVSPIQRDAAIHDRKAAKTERPAGTVFGRRGRWTRVEARS